jgi:uncharacterized membrane protein
MNNLWIAIFVVSFAAFDGLVMLILYFAYEIWSGYKKFELSSLGVLVVLLAAMFGALTVYAAIILDRGWS